MSEEEVGQEMANMRKQRDQAKVEPEAKASNKAQAAREARLAKMAQKEASEKSEMAEAVPSTDFLAEHTVVSGDNLTQIARKYYNSTDREKWMAIYEANKDIIGDNPSFIRVGQVLKIPVLSD